MINIPAGMRVIFSGSGKSPNNPIEVDKYTYILAEDVSLSLESHFTKLVDGSAPSMFKMMAGVTDKLFNFSVSGGYAQLGFQIWDSTEPLSFSFSVDLTMRTDARADVLDPMKALIKLPLPYDKGSIQGLVPPGPSLLTMLGQIGDKFEQSLTIKMGGLTLKDAILTSAQPTICRYVDNSDVPIYAKIQCTVQSSKTATKNLIDEML